MKQIVFDKSDFDQMWHLNRMHSYIEDTLSNINIATQDFIRFCENYSDQLKKFNFNFKLLNEEIKKLPRNLDFYQPDTFVSNQGLFCFELLDEIGSLLDENIQKFNLLKYFRNLHEDMFFDEIYY